MYFLRTSIARSMSDKTILLYINTCTMWVGLAMNGMSSRKPISAWLPFTAGVCLGLYFYAVLTRGVWVETDQVGRSGTE